MPEDIVTLADLNRAAGTDEAEVEYQGLKFRVTYYKDHYTPEMEDLLRSKERPANCLAASLATALVDWSLRDPDTKEPTKPTYDNLRSAGLKVMGAIMNAILAAETPKPTKSTS